MMNNSEGFSLVEVLISVGLLGAIALGVMKIMEGGYTQSADLTARQELREFRDELYLMMGKNSCGLKSPTATDLKSMGYNIKVDELKPPLSIPVLYGATGQTYRRGDDFGRISIESADPYAIALGVPSRDTPYLKNITDKSIGGYPKIENFYAGEIVIKVKKPAGASAKKKTSTVLLKFLALFDVDVDGNLISCMNLNEISSAKESCEAMQPDNGITVFWDYAELKCVISYESESVPPSGSCAPTEPCDVDPEYLYDNL